MGYTHYWQKSQVAPKELWDEFKKFVKQAIDKAEEDDGIVIKSGDGTGDPIITDDLISINGDASKGFDHETLYIKKDEAGGFNFCKTQYKPYDPVVVACLIEAEDLGIIDEWSSDGDATDHKDGIELRQAVKELLRVNA